MYIYIHTHIFIDMAESMLSRAFHIEQHANLVLGILSH